MNVWLIGATVLLGGLLLCGAVALRAPLLDALVALELASTVVALVLVLLAEGFHRSSYYTVPLALVVVSFAGGLVFVRMLGDRWL